MIRVKWCSMFCHMLDKLRYIILLGMMSFAAVSYATVTSDQFCWRDSYGRGVGRFPHHAPQARTTIRDYVTNLVVRGTRVLGLCVGNSARQVISTPVPFATSTSRLLWQGHGGAPPNGEGSVGGGQPIVQQATEMVPLGCVRSIRPAPRTG